MKTNTVERITEQIGDVLGPFAILSFEVVEDMDNESIYPYYICTVTADGRDTTEPAVLSFRLRVVRGALNINTVDDNWCLFSHEAIWRALFFAGAEWIKNNPEKVLDVQ